MAKLSKRPSSFFNEDDDYITSKEDRYSQLNRSTIRFQNRPSRYAPMYCIDWQPHFLDSCFLCRKSLAGDNDIFMYRGDTPFCSEGCREEQIEMDEAKEKHRNVSSSAMRAGLEKILNLNKAVSYLFRTGPGTVSAA